MSIDHCPTCASGTIHLLEWEFSGLGDSVFNYTADFHACPACGLVYVRNVTDASLRRFYVEECNYFENPHFAATSPANQKKYAFYMRYLREHEIISAAMADVGCGRGGFVNWMAESGWEKECWGVDVDVRSLPAKAGAGTNVSFRNGNCLNLPFAENSLGLLTYFHVLEHIRDLSGLLAEAARVLGENGHILIEVPDAENYAGYAHRIGILVFHPRAHQSFYCQGAGCGARGSQICRSQCLPPDAGDTRVRLPFAGDLGAEKYGHCRHSTCPPIADVAGFARMSREALMRQAEQISAIGGRSGNDDLGMLGRVIQPVALV